MSDRLAFTPLITPTRARGAPPRLAPPVDRPARAACGPLAPTTSPISLLPRTMELGRSERPIMRLPAPAPRELRVCFDNTQIDTALTRERSTADFAVRIRSSARARR